MRKWAIIITIESTKSVLFEFIRVILESLERRELALGMLLDLPKAYDCLNTNIIGFKSV